MKLYNTNIGILGMVDDNLGISLCDNSSVKKNAIINSFMEMQNLTLSKDKSKVVHIGSKSKCLNACPQLKVHNADMQETDEQKYLGDYIMSSGSNKSTIDHRRAKGYAQLSEIQGILSEYPLGHHKLESGLNLREAMLINGMMYSSEVWHGITLRDIARLEQVDTSLLSSLASGHPKCPKEFHFLETGTLMIRHILTMRRLIYHHHILTRNDREIVRKIYNKQKETPNKGDWVNLLNEDFNFIEEKMDEEEIAGKSAEVYKKEIKEKVRKYAFKEYIRLKNTHSKIKILKLLNT